LANSTKWATNQYYRATTTDDRVGNEKSIANLYSNQIPTTHP